jgi:hypothetical protein
VATKGTKIYATKDTTITKDFFAHSPKSSAARYATKVTKILATKITRITKDFVAPVSCQPSP